MVSPQDKLEIIYCEVLNLCEKVIQDKSYHPEARKIARQVWDIYYEVEHDGYRNTTIIANQTSSNGKTSRV